MPDKKHDNHYRENDHNLFVFTNEETIVSY